MLTEHFKNSIDASVVRGISSYQVKAPSHTTPPYRSQWSWALKSAPRASVHWLTHASVRTREAVGFITRRHHFADRPDCGLIEPLIASNRPRTPVSRPKGDTMCARPFGGSRANSKGLLASAGTSLRHA